MREGGGGGEVGVDGRAGVEGGSETDGRGVGGARVCKMQTPNAHSIAVKLSASGRKYRFEAASMRDVERYLVCRTRGGRYEIAYCGEAGVTIRLESEEDFHRAVLYLQARPPAPPLLRLHAVLVG